MADQQQQNQPKPLPDLAAWLVFQHQLDQEQLATKTAYGLAALWAILQFGKLDETTMPWLRATTLQIESSFRVAEESAFQMVQGVKWSWEPSSDPLEKIVTTFPTAEVQLGMRVTGPIAVKNRLPAPETEAMATGKVNSTGVGVKHAMNGARGEVQQLVMRDAARQKPGRRAIGWARVTDGNPCYFCALLASQGAVYFGSDSFDTSNSKIREVNKWRKTRRAFLGDGVAKVHDHCKCSLRPVYSVSDKHDERANYFLNQWENLDKLGLDYKEQVKEFRKFYVPPAPYRDAPVVDLNAVRANREALKSGFGASSPQVGFYDRQIQKLA